jgi:hypothetical protein
MAEFIVTTDEHVTGTYAVEAASEDEARAKFGDPRIDWETVTQLDYMAYSCVVQKVREGAVQ